MRDFNMKNDTEKNENGKKFSIRRVLLYSVSGVAATAVEWVLFYVLNSICMLHYEVATVIAMLCSTLAGWAVGRLLVFKDTGNPVREIGLVYITSIIGILGNMLLMWILAGVFKVSPMLSKMISTVIVFFWNYLVREYFIYR